MNSFDIVLLATGVVLLLWLSALVAGASGLPWRSCWIEPALVAILLTASWLLEAETPPRLGFILRVFTGAGAALAAWHLFMFAGSARRTDR